MARSFGRNKDTKVFVKSMSDYYDMMINRIASNAPPPKIGDGVL